MKRNDFTEGQKVTVLLVGDAARGIERPKDRIKTGIVKTVGRKYLTVSVNYKDIRFGIDCGFRQAHYTGAIEYELFLEDREAFDELWRRSTILKLVRSNSWLQHLSLEDLKTVYGIAEKYMEK